jgi:hypothetical protein
VGYESGYLDMKVSIPVIETWKFQKNQLQFKQTSNTIFLLCYSKINHKKIPKRVDFSNHPVLSKY